MCCSQRRRRIYRMMLLALNLEEFTCRRWILVNYRQGRWKVWSARRGLQRTWNSRDLQRQLLTINLSWRSADSLTLTWKLTSSIIKITMKVEMLDCSVQTLMVSFEGFMLSYVHECIWKYSDTKFLCVIFVS